MLLALACARGARGQAMVLRLDPARTRLDITLGATMHTVRGTFALKQGEVRFDPASGKVSGEIVFDATSGKTGNDSRDQKMHAEVLQSGQYPEIRFRLDRVEGSVAGAGSSSVQVHGQFGIHGADHEMNIPVVVVLNPQDWTAEARFSIPYIEWGLKNPSTFLLRVAKTVDVELHAAGAVSR